jgi:hypothetical protein
MDLNALGLLPDDEDEEDEVSLTCFWIGNVLTTLYVLCMYLCILGNAVTSLFPSFLVLADFPDYGSIVIDSEAGKRAEGCDLAAHAFEARIDVCARRAFKLKWCTNKEISVSE